MPLTRATLGGEVIRGKRPRTRDDDAPTRAVAAATAVNPAPQTRNLADHRQGDRSGHQHHSAFPAEPDRMIVGTSVLV